MLKEKEDEDARVRSQAKRLDYITRSLRLEEMPVLRKKYEKQVHPSSPLAQRPPLTDSSLRIHSIVRAIGNQPPIGNATMNAGRISFAREITKHRGVH